MPELLTITLALLLGFQSGWLASSRFHRRLRGSSSGNDRDDE
jgi:hypothetical protein